MFVVANIVLNVAKEDIDKADMIQKLRTSVYGLMASEATHGKLNFLQSIELNAVRPLLPQVRSRRPSFISSDTGYCCRPSIRRTG